MGRRRSRSAGGTAAALALAALAGCSGSASAGGCGAESCPAAPVTPADRAFVAQMLPHHEAAIAVGQLAAHQGSDPRVRSFGLRIVAEQTPELQRLRADAAALGVPPDPAHADGIVTQGEQLQLAGLTGPAFDRAVLQRSAASERGAVQMAKAELADGHDPTTLAIARPISTAGNPGSEIDQLLALAAQLPGAGAPAG